MIKLPNNVIFLMYAWQHFALIKDDWQFYALCRLKTEASCPRELSENGNFML